MKHNMLSVLMAFIGIATLAILLATHLAAHTRATDNHRSLSFRLKIRLLVFLNKLFLPCRHDIRPETLGTKCHICAQEGGWTRCLRSKLIRITGNIQQEKKQGDPK